MHTPPFFCLVNQHIELKVKVSTLTNSMPMCKECLYALFRLLLPGNKTLEGCSLYREWFKLDMRKTIATLRRLCFDIPWNVKSLVLASPKTFWTKILTQTAAPWRTACLWFLVNIFPPSFISILSTTLFFKCFWTDTLKWFPDSVLWNKCSVTNSCSVVVMLKGFGQRGYCT